MTGLIDDLRPNRQLGWANSRSIEKSLQFKEIHLNVNGEIVRVHAYMLKRYALAIRHKLEVIIQIENTEAQIFVNKKKEEALKPTGMKKNYIIGLPSRLLLI